MQNLPHSVGQAKRTISPPLGARENTKLPAHLRLSPLQGREACALPAQRARKIALSLTLLSRQNAQSPLPCKQRKNTKLPTHLRQAKQRSLTHLFSAESLGFPRSRVGKRALYLPKEQGRVCILPCLREGSFTLLGGAHFWSLHPPPALNISSPTPGMFAISQSSFMPDFISLFSHPPLQRGKLRLSPLQGRKACALPAQRARKIALSLTLLTHLFSAESLCFPGSRVGKRALYLPKEQGRVCILPCLREGSFTLLGGAHFWSLHPPPALNIPSPTLGMFAISQSSFMPDFISLFVLHCKFIFVKKLFINKELLLLHCSCYVYYFIFPIFNCSLFAPINCLILLAGN
ncbi:hypothetical protein T4D_15797 [Trichinella pseudospiralis]|uniref:Uncharacterized protein n=1 Tax=Trichinella pseudospiralis TaxID=6337 RepID=A0A0V1FPG3_TRIPS|nr:hypothetical protein T4D_15797 [Trichinella pseudospiralis]